MREQKKISIEKERSLREVAMLEKKTKEGRKASRKRKQRVGHLRLRKQSREREGGQAE